ncbi:SMC-Scp complex subunit ScpB [Gammaproteobacteria bacterium]|jgi:segregation and condensation protein B|nr:SMC-Scp complex subunit ScpB [Gammaproteobacteria bacterium]MDC0413496.1 SMC-Scp complex subunit ScpB [Gammaproteobacteria bacterium]
MSEVDNKVKMIVEGLLLAAGRPLTLDNIIQVFSKDEQPDRKELIAVMESIAEECDGRGFELKEVASGYRFQVKQELSEWVAKLWEERPPRYTRALLETLALVAYRQPITRGDIEEIRGVGVSSNIIRTLLDREWIRVVGHRDVPGRPAMFATTKQFLDYFNLKSLQDLPPLSEIRDLAEDEPEFDLEDDLAGQRILELPEELVDENSIELSESDKAELIAEEEAVALAAKPLDEILELPPELQYPVVEEEDEEDLEPDAEETEFAEEFGLKELDEALDSIEAVEITFTESESDEDSQTDSAADEEDTAQAESTEIDFSVNEDDSKTQH